MSIGDDQISLTRTHKAKARRLIARGDYPDMSALVNDAMRYLISIKSVAEPPERELKALIEKRSKGPFVPLEKPGVLTDRLVARARALRGLPDRKVARRRA